MSLRPREPVDPDLSRLTDPAPLPNQGPVPEQPGHDLHPVEPVDVVWWINPGQIHLYAKELVERGDYPNVSAAVSGELARARAAREREQTLLAAEVRRRLQVPTDQWEPVTGAAEFTADARAFLTERQTEDPSRA